MRAETPKVDKAVSTEDEDSLAGQQKLPKNGISDIERLEAVLAVLLQTKVVAMKAAEEKENKNKNIKKSREKSQQNEENQPGAAGNKKHSHARHSSPKEHKHLKYKTRTCDSTASQKSQPANISPKHHESDKSFPRLEETSNTAKDAEARRQDYRSVFRNMSDESRCVTEPVNRPSQSIRPSGPSNSVARSCILHNKPCKSRDYTTIEICDDSEVTTVQLCENQNTETLKKRQDVNSENFSLAQNYQINSKDDTTDFYNNTSGNYDHCDQAKYGLSDDPNDTRNTRNISTDMGNGDLKNSMSKSERKHHHRKHRKHGKKKRKRVFMATLDEKSKVKVVDPDELPHRARWTIIATACLLLMMCMLLVGITLRMAPIIDDMVREENERLMHEAMNREIYTNPNATDDK